MLPSLVEVRAKQVLGLDFNVTGREKMDETSKVSVKEMETLPSKEGLIDVLCHWHLFLCETFMCIYCISLVMCTRLQNCQKIADRSLYSQGRGSR